MFMFPLKNLAHKGLNDPQQEQKQYSVISEQFHLLIYITASWKI